MSLMKYANDDFLRQSKRDGWFFVTDGVFDTFAADVNQRRDALGPYVFSHVEKIYPEV